MAVTFTTPLDLPQLATELTAASIPVPHGLGTLGDEVFTYDAEGDPVDLPPAAQAVVDAHVNQAAATEAAAKIDWADLRDQAAQMITRANQIETQMGGTPTNAQVVAGVRDLAIGVRRLTKAVAYLAAQEAGPPG